MRTIAALMLLAVAFAGCVEELPEPEANESAPVDPVEDNNVTELPRFKLDFAAENETGMVGSALNFTLNATVAPEDNVTDLSAASWTVSITFRNSTGNQTVEAGNETIVAEEVDSLNGTGLPATFNYTFEQNGTYGLMATVMIDGYQAEEAVLDAIAIEAAVEVVEDAFDPITFEGSIEAPCNQCYSAGDGDLCVGFQAGSNEQDCVWFAFEEDYAGRTFESFSEGGDSDVAFYSECSPGNQINFVGATGHDTGIIPEGAGCVLLVDWLGSGAMTFTVS